MGNTWGVHVHPEVNPHPEKGVTFDPLLGFEKGRKVRGAENYLSLEKFKK